VPSNGSDSVYAQRENRLTIRGSVSLPLSNVL
jgi:hypothetical protein